MDFNFTEEQQMIRDTVAKFVEKEVAPYAQDWDEKNEFPIDTVKRFHEAGLFNYGVPEEYGGPGLDDVAKWLLSMELARGDAGIATTIGVTNTLAPEPVMIAGTEEQKQRWFDITNNGGLSAMCITEPGAGSDTSAISLNVKKDGDFYVLNGTKIFISNGGYAEQFAVIGTMDKKLGRKGMCWFMVPRKTPGLKIGKKENKLGLRSSSTNEIIFEDCRVHKDNLIGQEGDGFNILMKTFDLSRFSVSSLSCGVATAAYEYAVEYAKQRKQFGRPIIEFQAIQFLLSDMLIKIEAGMLLALKAIWLKMEGKPFNQASSIAKKFCGDMCMEVTTDAIQVLGGYGYIKDYPVEKYMRDAKIMQIFEGTSQIQSQIIANTIIKGLR